jgi:voltage-gated potassium channel
MVLPVSAVVVLLAGGGFAALETKNVSSYAEGVWWALSLMTTVGFVGESPETTAGRILSAVLMLIGFGLLSVTTAVIASLFVREDEAPEERREQAFEEEALQRLEELGRRLDRLERSLSDRERV